MSIFGMINDAVLNAAAQAQSAPGATGAAAAAGATGGQGPDMETAMAARLQAKGNPALNWKSSVVDLMKLLDLDAGLDNRKALATELGYAGALDGSAEMNIWLHRKVMEQLAANGANVPASLAD